MRLFTKKEWCGNVTYGLNYNQQLLTKKGRCYVQKQAVSKPERVAESHGVKTEERMARLARMDLECLKRALMQPVFAGGQGWSEKQVTEALKWYKRFLGVRIHFPSAILVPNKVIDAVWHGHILDTAKYRQDCAHVLGKFLDHTPGYGLNGDADERDDSFVLTQALFRDVHDVDCRAMLDLFRRGDVGKPDTTADTSCNSCASCATSEELAARTTEEFGDPGDCA